MLSKDKGGERLRTNLSLFIELLFSYFCGILTFGAIFLKNKPKPSGSIILG